MTNFSDVTHVTYILSIFSLPVHNWETIDHTFWSSPGGVEMVPENIWIHTFLWLWEAKTKFVMSRALHGMALQQFKHPKAPFTHFLWHVESHQIHDVRLCDLVEHSFSHTAHVKLLGGLLRRKFSEVTSLESCHYSSFDRPTGWFLRDRPRFLQPLYGINYYSYSV